MNRLVSAKWLAFTMVAMLGFTAEADTFSPQEVIALGQKLCDFVAATGERKVACEKDVSDQLIHKPAASEADLHLTVLNVCDKAADKRKLVCFSSAKAMMKEVKGVGSTRELSSCKSRFAREELSCLRSVFVCEKDFPFLKFGMRNQAASIRALKAKQARQPKQKAPKPADFGDQPADQQWLELTTLEATPENSGQIRACAESSAAVLGESVVNQVLRALPAPPKSESGSGTVR